ncbi:hypothetical protein ACOME3_001445 [Neoechinorhynchus agilis]
MLGYSDELTESRDESMEISESGGEDSELTLLKRNALQRKGRGFHQPSGREQVRDDEFERGQSDDDDEAAVTDDCPAQRSVEGWIVFVRNVHEEATEEHVRDVFRDFGKLKNLHLNIDRRTGFIKGYAMIEYEKYTEARRAISQIDGTEFLGRIIRVDWAFRRNPLVTRRDRRRGGVESYRNQPPPRRY